MTGIFRLNSLLLAFILAGAVTAYAQTSFTVDVPAVVSSSEDFKVVFTAVGEERISDFKAPSFDGFEVLAGPIPTTMTNVQIVNGKKTQSRSESFTYLLSPRGTGKFSIPSASIKIGKETYKSEPVEVEVVEGTVDHEGEETAVRAGDDLILSMSADKKDVVIGEPITVTLKLYVQSSAISGFEDIRFPVFDGFWSQETEAPQNIQFVRENYKGKVYNAALLRRYMLIPQQEGKLSVEPATMTCLVQVRAGSSASRSIFDDMFSTYQTIRKRLSSPELEIRVRPLPSGAPSSFAGGVGSFRMTAGFDSDSVAAHEATSLRISVSGSGNINLIEAPKVKFPADFETYDVRKTDKITAGKSGASGTVTFEYPFIPRVPGTYSLPPVEFSYYDIASGKYRTLSSGPLNLEVAAGRKTDASVAPSGTGKQTVRSLGEDIRYISVSQPRLRRQGRQLVDSPVIYVVPLLVIVLSAIAWALLERSAALRSDVAAGRNRRARKVAGTRLRNAAAFMKQNLYAAFYEELHKAIYGYVADKLMLPVSDLTRDRIASELAGRGKSETLVKELFDILDACEYARYAPSGENGAMENHYRQAVKVISEIES